MTRYRSASRNGLMIILAGLGIVAAAPAQTSQPVADRAAIKSPAAMAGKPAIVVDSADHDFGQTWAGTKLDHAFKLTNTGTGEVKILRVQPNCGCTIAGEYPKSLPPGASGLFPFSLNTAAVTGQFNKSISIYSSDPALPELKLALKGTVKPYISIEPPGAFFGSIYGAATQTRLIKLENNRDAPLKLVIDPLASLPPFAFELTEKVPGRSFELRVTLNPAGLKPGPVQRGATLLSNVEAQHYLQVSTSATIRDRIDVEPAVLTLFPPATQPQGMYAGGRTASQPAPGAAGIGVTRVVRVQNYGDKPVAVLGAACDDPAVVIKLQEQVAGKSYLVTLSGPPGYVPATEGRTISITTDDPEKPRILVPIRKGEPYRPPTPAPAMAARPGATAAPAAAPRPNPLEKMIGQPAPTFALTTLQGKPVSNEAVRNRVTVLNFFSPSCGFCKKQLPRVETLRQAYESKGVRFVNVGESMGAVPATAETVTAKLQEWGVKAEGVVDTGNRIGMTFGVHSYPTMFVVGKNGKIEAVNSGNMADLEMRLKTQLDAAVAKGG